MMPLRPIRQVCVCMCMCMCECEFSIKAYISSFALENSLIAAEEHQTDSQISDRTLVLCLSESVVNLLCLLPGLTLAATHRFTLVPSGSLNRDSEHTLSQTAPVGHRDGYWAQKHTHVCLAHLQALVHLWVIYLFVSPLLSSWSLQLMSAVSVSCHPTTKQYLHVHHYSYITKVD